MTGISGARIPYSASRQVVNALLRKFRPKLNAAQPETEPKRARKQDKASDPRIPLGHYWRIKVTTRTPGTGTNPLQPLGLPWKELLIATTALAAFGSAQTQTVPNPFRRGRWSGRFGQQGREACSAAAEIVGTGTGGARYDQRNNGARRKWCRWLERRAARRRSLLPRPPLPSPWARSRAA